MLPVLQLLPMPQRRTAKQEEEFLYRLHIEMGEQLELGVLPPNIRIEDVSWQVRWGLELVLVQEGPPLLPLGEEPMEAEGGA